jgi:tRNA pseudouridine65 synthase
VELDILYCDDTVVAVNKPAGLAVHRGWADDDQYAMTLVRDRIGAWVYPVHRLDRGASGVLVFGRSSDAARALCEQFARGKVDKRYLAIVRGSPPASARIDHALRADDDKLPREARTDIECVSRFGRYAVVLARPHTGRLHQIRRHLKHIACPIIGDVRYGKGEHNRLFRTRYALHRLALHASSLGVAHPSSGELLRFEAALAPDLARTLEMLATEGAEH